MQRDQIKTAGHPNPGGVEQYPGMNLVKVVMRELANALVNENVLTLGWITTAYKIEKMNTSDLAETLSAMIFDIYDNGILELKWVARATQLSHKKDWMLVIQSLIGLIYDLHLDDHIEYDWLEYADMLKAVLREMKNQKGGKK